MLYSVNSVVHKIIFSFSIMFISSFSLKSEKDRYMRIEKWHKESGVLVLGYDMFRLLAEDILSIDSDELSIEKMQLKIMLLHPGPDVVVCDEGHLLKNDNTSISDVLSNVRTPRKIILTGTPLIILLNIFVW